MFYCTMPPFQALILIFGCWSTASFAYPIHDEDEAALYLQKFGYLEYSTGYRVGALVGSDGILGAIKDLLTFSGINQTDSQWRTADLTNHISKYPERLKNKTKKDREIARAFKIWSDISTLTFGEPKRGRVNIDIRFETGEQEGEDNFVRPRKSLTHVFFPQFGGDAHFDNGEKSTFKERLGSLNQPSSPKYEEEPSGKLPDTSNAPNLCHNATFDTITLTQNGSTYVFKGDFYWDLLQVGDDSSVAEGFPRKISDDWGGLEGNLDAMLTWPNFKTYFFKGNRYWSFTNKKMDSGYPKLINHGFQGIPDMLDAAFVWNGNDKTYFFKGDKYWGYDIKSDPPVSDEYPKPISNWNGLPNNLDDVIQWERNRTYFFKGDMYYRFNDITGQVDRDRPAFPRPTSTWWFGC